jgi:hypothetical protein
MIDLPTKAEVHCSDGAAGRSTYVIFNPITHQMTRLVVQSEWPPFHEVLMPVDQMEETIPNLIKLKCTRNDLRVRNKITSLSGGKVVSLLRAVSISKEWKSVVL